MLCKLHNLVPVLIHLNLCDASKKSIQLAAVLDSAAVHQSHGQEKETRVPLQRQGGGQQCWGHLSLWW